MATKKADGNVPATTTKGELARFDYGAYTGEGYEGTDHEDFAIAYLNLLQPLSPEVGEEGGVEGAKAGMMINSVTKELFDPKVGVVFVPVSTNHAFVEWRPRDSGGGIVARHLAGSDLVAACKAKSQFGDYKTEEGNDLIETFYMFGYLLSDKDATEPADPIVISFWSTKIKIYKRIMQTLRTFKGRPPLFANRLLIQTTSEKNNQGAFHNYRITPVNGTVGDSLIPPVDAEGKPNPLLKGGKLLSDQVRSGERRTADESLKEGPSGSTEKVPF